MKTIRKLYSLLIMSVVMVTTILNVGPANGATYSFDFNSGLTPNFTVVNSGDLYKVDTDGGKLRISKPADNGAVNRYSFVTAGIGSNFTCDGDFTATVDFTLNNFPSTPSWEQLNESILGVMPAGGGSVFEILRYRQGSQNLIEVWNNMPLGSQSSMLNSGRYRVVRSGTTFTGLVAPSGSSTFTPIASNASFAGPASFFAYASQGINRNGAVRSMTALDISFDNLVIENAQCSGVWLPPSADAGPDQTVDEETSVTLDGSGSHGPEGMTYDWSLIPDDPAIILNIDDPIHPTFTAPSVPVGGKTFTFRLTVTAAGITSSDEVNITVKNINYPPISEAGNDQIVKEGATVTLNGSDSYDPDGDSLSYIWNLQPDGHQVTLSDTNSVRPSFTAPMVGPEGAVLIFTLTVSDGIYQHIDTVRVVVENENHPPIADAGADQTKDEESLVTLDGTNSSDPDGDTLTYTWTQISGSPVKLSDTNSPAPYFTAPLIGPGNEPLEFALVVSDGVFDSEPDHIVVKVLNVIDPPACESAQPSIASLWPPSHKLQRVGILGITDPNNDQVTVTVTSVTQDEPVNGLGDGDTSPDAVIHNGGVLLRAERSGTGNGRVYRVNFTADDGKVGVCTGSVLVAVPFGSKDVPIDSGQVYDALQP